MKSEASRNGISAMAGDVLYLTTEGLPDPERLPYWVDAVCNTFIRVDCRPAPGIPLQGAIASRAFPDLSVSRVRASAQDIAHQAPSATPAKEVLYLTTHVSGDWRMCQDGRWSELRSGDLALFDGGNATWRSSRRASTSQRSNCPCPGCSDTWRPPKCEAAA